MSNHYILRIENGIEYFFFALVCIFILLSVLWIVYFVKRILYFVRSYHRSIEESATDILGNSSEAALYYKVEIVKFSLLLLVNFFESMTIVMFEFSFFIISSDPIHNETDNCTIKDTYNPDFNILANPVAAVFAAIGNTTLIWSLVLVICLMRYLEVKFHNVNGETLPFIRCILVVSLLAGVVLIVTESVSQLFIFEKLLEPVVGSVYFVLWAKQTNTFYKTLKWRTVEFKVRGRSRETVERSIKSRYHFAVIMSSMGIGFLCILLHASLQIYSFIIMTVVYYGPCLFHHLYGTAYYKPLLTSEQQIETLRLISEIVSEISTVLLVISSIVIVTPYLFVTTAFFGGKLWKALKFRFGRVRTRFTPSLTDPLLIT